MVKQILKLSEFNPTSVKFSAVKKNRVGGSLVYPNINGQNIVVQTPKLFLPFGVSTQNEMKSSVSLTTSLKGYDQEGSAQQVFSQKLQELDRMVIKEAATNSDWQKLLGLKKGKVTEEMVEMLYVPLHKHQNEQYAPNFNVKLPVEYEGTEVKTELYKNKQRIALTTDNVIEQLPRFSDVRFLIRVGSVWFINKKFGVTIRAVQAVIYPSAGIQKTVFSVADVSATDLSFSDVKKNKRGGALVYPKMKGASASLTLPTLKAPFGVSCYQNDGKAPSLSLPLSLDGYQTEDDVMALHKLLEGLDNAVLEQALSNTEWHPLLGIGKRKKVSKETLEMLYTPMLRHNDERYPPNVSGKLQIDFESQKLRTKVFVDGEEVDATTESVLDLVSRGAQVKATIQFGGVWFVNKKFGLSLRVEKIELEKSDEIQGYSFEDSDDEELEEDFEDSDDEVDDSGVEDASDDEDVSEEEEEVSDDE